MISTLTLLLVFQLAGEVLARAFALPVPGPVIGMALLFTALVLRGGPSDNLRHSAGQLLQHLSLLFVPAGTGVVLHSQLIANEWLPLTAALLVSTLLSMVVTALVLRAFSPRPASARHGGAR